MLENLIEYLNSRDEDQLRAMYLEDVALCSAWYDSHREDPARQQLYAGLPQRFGLWLSNAAPPEAATEGLRQQPLLRFLLTVVEKEGLDALLGDDLAFLLAVWNLIQRSEQREFYARPEECLKPHLHGLRERLQELGEEPGLPGIDERIGIYTIDELRNAPVREAKIFAGLEISIRGPVLAHSGQTKIIGGIPEGCAVVVEEGMCSVNGPVIGNLAATESCDVFDNIAGLVVARRGDVRAANIVNQATAISKEGSVYCRNALQPRLVYGYQSIEISDRVTSGLYFTRNFHAQDEVIGGEIHITERAEAQWFRRTDERPLAFVLRRAINCRDYGEVLNADASRMLVNVTKLGQRAENLRHLQEISEREADDYAGNILMFLLGEENTLEQMQNIERLRRRVAYIDRLTSGIRALISILEDRLNVAPTQTPLEGDDTASASSEAAILEQMQRELMLLASEGTIDRDLFVEREDVIHLGHRLQRKTLTRQQAADTLKDLLAKLDGLAQKREDLTTYVAKKEGELKNAVERAAILQRAKEKCNRVEVLEQLLAAGRDKGGSETLKRRMVDRYVRLMQRNIENRMSRVTEYRTTQQDIQARLSHLRQKLWSEYMISLPENILDEQSVQGPTVSGKFDAGVRLCVWRHLLESNQATGPGILVTPDSMDAAVSYKRTSHGAIEPVDSTVVR